MRLDRFLGNATDLSRSEAQRAIRAGRVAVDGESRRDPGWRLTEGAQVALDGETVALPGLRYLMLHKPAGAVCSHAAEGHPTVFSLVRLPRPEALQAAGRLDADTTGLLLLSDDGQWIHQVTAPRRHCPKRYRVEVVDPLPEPAAEALRAGILLHGESTPTRPAELERVGPTTLQLTLREGRYHQVKRMLAAVGNRVTALHREQVGTVALDPTLAPGQWRPLTEAEAEALAHCGK